MSTHGRSPQRDTEGQRQDSVSSKAQRGAGRKAHRDDCPFPNKPVSHRSSFSSRTQNSLDLIDVENNSHTKQPVRETTRSQHPTKDLHRLPSEELQMAKAIHEKQLKLQEKLWRVEEKIKHKIQSHRAEAAEAAAAAAAAAAGHGEMKRRGRGQPEPGRAQIQERKQVDVKEIRGKHDQQSEERMKNTYGEDEAGGRRGETEGSQSKGKSERNKSRRENVKEHSRRDWEERDDDVHGEEDVRSQQKIGDAGRTREEKYWERTYDEQQDAPQIREQESLDRQERGNHRDAEHKISREPSLPRDLSLSHSGRRQEEEEEEKLGLMEDSTGANFQLFPCRMCNRMFARERLEKHVQICKKVKQSQRQVFNSYAHRTKGSALEEFLRTHTRSQTPEIFQKKNCRQNDPKAKTKTVQHNRLPAGTSHSKRSK